MAKCSLVRLIVWKLFVSFPTTVFAQNSIPNGDFDFNSIGWSGGTLSLTDGMPSAPSFLVVSPANSERVAYSDCFALPSDHTKEYSFSGEMKTTNPHVGIITLYIYQDPNCTMELNIRGTGAIFGDGSWNQLSIGPPFFLPANSVSGKVEVIANDGSGSEADVHFDHIVLEPEDIFANDFDN